MSKDTIRVIKYYGILFVIFLVFWIAAKSNNSADSYYKENKDVIDTYNENHKDDWDGYKGMRRNSPAETRELENDGYDPDEYRRLHGY